MRPCRGITSPISRGRLARALLPLVLWRRGQGRGEVALKSEGRSPRAERRPSSEIRRPKPEVEGDSGFDLLSAFDLRPSDLPLEAITRTLLPELFARSLSAFRRTRPPALMRACFSLSSFGGEGWGEEAPAVFRDYRPETSSIGVLLLLPAFKWAEVLGNTPCRWQSVIVAARYAQGVYKGCIRDLRAAGAGLAG